MNRCKRFMIQKALYPCLDKALTLYPPLAALRLRAPIDVFIFPAIINSEPSGS